MSLNGMSILLVEDEPLIGLDVLATLQEAGATVHGPCANVSQAMDALDSAEPELWDCAVLDFRLGMEESTPVARRLYENRVPFVLHTASAKDVRRLAQELSAEVVSKPCYGRRLIDALEGIVSPFDR